MLHFLLLLLLPLATLAQTTPVADAAMPPGAVEEVPYVTTPDNVTAAMLEIAGVKAGDHVIDLGSGDGRIVIAAARRGATGLGVEIDGRLVAESLANARRAGVAERARFLEQDLFRTDLAPATVVTMYLLPDVNLKLRPSLLALRPGTRVVSHDWDMGDWMPDRSRELAVPDKKIGLHKSSHVHLWIVPARVEGLWCESAAPPLAALRLRQSFQKLSGEIGLGAHPGVLPVTGEVSGTAVEIAAARPAGRLRLEVRGGTMRAVAAEGSLAGGAGRSWRAAAACEAG